MKGYQNFATSLCKRLIAILKISRLQFHYIQMILNRATFVLWFLYIKNLCEIQGVYLIYQMYLIMTTRLSFLLGPINWLQVKDYYGIMHGRKRNNRSPTLLSQFVFSRCWVNTCIRWSAKQNLRWKYWSKLTVYTCLKTKIPWIRRY